MNVNHVTPDMFDECLTRMQKGETVEEVLVRFPNVETELRPLLMAALTLMVTPSEQTIPLAARERSRARLLAEAARKRALVLRPAASWRCFSLRSVIALVLLFSVVAFSLGSVSLASASALPGDQLYPVKRTVERVQLQFTLDSAARLNLEDQFESRRQQEVEDLIRAGRIEPVSFSGFIQHIAEGQWEINGIGLDVPSGEDTQLTLDEKVQVEIQGVSQADGRVRISKAIPHSYEIDGKLENQTPTTWQVGGVSVHIDENTQMSVQPVVGGNLKIQAVRDETDDSYHAVKVEVEKDKHTYSPPQPSEDQHEENQKPEDSSSSEHPKEDDH
jgi:hypothetical protein